MFNSESEDLGGFIEIVEPGFFGDALRNSDIRCLINHNWEKVLGRESAGTLTVEESENGLVYRCSNPGTTYANDLAISIERGDINQSSFGFTIKSKDQGDDIDGQRWEKGPDEVWRRYLVSNGCKRIYDVSPVTLPAYPDATVGQRSLEDHIKKTTKTEENKETLTELMEAKKRYLDLLD